MYLGVRGRDSGVASAIAGRTPFPPSFIVGVSTSFRCPGIVDDPVACADSAPGGKHRRNGKAESMKLVFHPQRAQETTEADVLTAKIDKSPEMLGDPKFRLRTSGRKFGIVSGLLLHRR